MKRALLSFGIILTALGLGLTLKGRAMGGASTATLNLFGRSWSVSAPTIGFAAGPFVRHDSVIIRVDEERIDGGKDPSPTPEAFEGYALQPGEAVTAEPFRSLEIDVDMGDITVAAGEDYAVYVDCPDSFEAECWNLDGFLTIQGRGGAAFLAEGGMYACHITVYVPEGCELDWLYVDADFGNVKLVGISADTAEFSLDLGSLTGENLTIRESLTVQADLGDVSLHGDFGEMTDVSADLGSVALSVTRPAADYCWELEAGLGSIRADGITADGWNGTLNGGRGPRIISVRADLGSISVDFDQPTPAAGEETFVVEDEAQPVTVFPGGATLVEEDVSRPAAVPPAREAFSTSSEIPPVEQAG